MFRKAISFGGLLFLGGAAVLVTPGFGQAQHHGGGGHGGFNHGGLQHGFHHDFHRRGWWYPGHGCYPGYYGGYGAWPYNSGYYPYSYDTYSDGLSNPAYDSGYYDSHGDLTPSYLDSDLSLTAQPDTRAQITVSVPADAEIWFEGSKTTLTGSVREYQSPPLTPGSRYTYEVRARWNENGHEVTQTQQVEITAGTRVNVHFPVQPRKARTAPSD